MTPDPLDALLEQLCSGDSASAEQVFRAYEPYLRMVVRRMLPGHLLSKFDSVDVVQSVWVDVLEGFRDARWRFASAAHLRAFLVKATRNRFLDRMRQHQSVLAHEKALPAGSLDAPRTRVMQPTQPGDIVAADDLWERMLAMCPPAHQEVLRLKRQGHSLAEVAQHTGYHPSSVRRIFYDLAQRLAGAGQEVGKDSEVLNAWKTQ
jgi:RNA polymerase sigma-70 factor (ECF subfamily)